MEKITAENHDNHNSEEAKSKIASQPEEEKKMEILPSDYSKDSFKKTFNICAVKVPVSKISNILKEIKDYLLNIEKFPNVAKEPYKDAEYKLLYLNRNYQRDNPSFWPEKLTSWIKENNYEIEDVTITLGFDHFSAQDVLAELLPKDIIIPSGFEIVGTIAHLNLRGPQLPYKRIIGQVFLDKNPRLKTVVNKTEAIHNVYRVADLEVIAGEENYETQLKEGNCVFQLSFDKVYWNSRLQYERDRILENLAEGETLCDMFCGIGPLSVRAAKKGLSVVANDLNPACYDYLLINTKLNKVEKQMLNYNMDARGFIKYLMSDEFQKNEKIDPKFKYFHHIYMNLPADAVEFLDVFRGIMAGKEFELWKGKVLPFVRVYAFDSGETDSQVKTNIAERIRKVYGEFDESEIKELHKIKDVSTNKSMYCIGFRLTERIVCDTTSGNESEKIMDPERSPKKVKTQ